MVNTVTERLYMKIFDLFSWRVLFLNHLPFFVIEPFKKSVMSSLKNLSYAETCAQTCNFSSQAELRVSF